MQVNSHQLRKQPIALESNELKINQPKRGKKHTQNNEFFRRFEFEFTVQKY